MSVQHSMDVVQPDPQALMKLLDDRVAEGYEFLQVLLLPMSQSSMQGGSLIQSKPQPMFGVIFRKEVLPTGDTAGVDGEMKRVVVE